MNTRSIFLKGDMADVVLGVFDVPMASVGGAGALRRQGAMGPIIPADQTNDWCIAPFVIAALQPQWVGCWIKPGNDGKGTPYGATVRRLVQNATSAVSFHNPVLALRCGAGRCSRRRRCA